MAREPASYGFEPIEVLPPKQTYPPMRSENEEFVRLEDYLLGHLDQWVKLETPARHSKANYIKKTLTKRNEGLKFEVATRKDMVEGSNLVDIYVRAVEK